VPLSDTRSLWLFGDSFVGAPGQRDRRGSVLVHNTIAISECRPGEGFRIRYRWGEGPDGVPRAFVERGEPDTWWWIFDGFVHAGRLYLGLLEVERAPPAGPLGLPFRFTGMQLGRIADPEQEPDRWTLEPLPLSAGSGALPASAMVVHGGFLHLFTFLDPGQGRHPRGLCRVPLEALDGERPDPAAALECLGRDGWRRGLDPTDLRILMDDDATEMSVRFHPELGKWLALYAYPGLDGSFPAAGPDDAVWVRTADALEGPWSEPRVLFRMPELDPDYVGGHDPNTGCYAAKEQGQFSTPGGVTLTYVCNLFAGPDGDADAVLGRLVVEMGLYRPIPVWLELPTD
jgi:hypothetical protein